MPAPKPSSNITQTSKMELGPEQKKVFDLAFPSIEEYSASTPSIFAGTGIQGFTPEEQAAQEGYLTAAAKTGGMAEDAARVQGLMLNPDFMLNPNQYVNAAAQATTDVTTQNLMEKILPGVRSGDVAAGGMYSGGATRGGLAEGKAIGDTNRGLSNSLADMYFKNYQTGMAGMDQAMGRNQQVMQQQLFPSDVMSAVGAQKRGLAQAQLDEEIRKFYTQQDLPLLKGQQLLSLISGMPGGTGTTTVSGAMPQTNPMMQMMGLGMSLMGGLGGGGGGGGMASMLPMMLSI